MAINLRSTSDVHLNGVKIAVYGNSGAGKTTLIPTLPNAVILSAEGGLLSISDANLPFIEISNVDELMQAYTWLTESDEAKQFESVALDSISEIAEVVLNSEKKTQKDGRAAYGSLNEKMTDIIRAFRDLPNKNVLFTAKCDKTADESGRILYSPSMPGKSLSQQLPYFFDEVLALRVERDEAGVTHRALLTDSDGIWQAKDRSGKLDTWESPDLGAIIRKISAASS